MRKREYILHKLNLIKPLYLITINKEEIQSQRTCLTPPQECNWQIQTVGELLFLQQITCQKKEVEEEPIDYKTMHLLET